MNTRWPDLLNAPDNLSEKHFREIARRLVIERSEHISLNCLCCFWQADPQVQAFANNEFVDFAPIKAWDYLLHVYKQSTPDSPLEIQIRNMFITAFGIQIDLTQLNYAEQRSKYIGSRIFEPRLHAYYVAMSTREYEILSDSPLTFRPTHQRTWT